MTPNHFRRQTEEQEDQIVLMGKKTDRKLSWEETARQIASEQEDWAEWESRAADGLDNCPWEHPLPPEAVDWLNGGASAAPGKKSRARK
jgi:hypothetical protein